MAVDTKTVVDFSHQQFQEQYRGQSISFKDMSDTSLSKDDAAGAQGGQNEPRQSSELPATDIEEINDNANQADHKVGVHSTPGQVENPSFNFVTGSPLPERPSTIDSIGDVASGSVSPAKVDGQELSTSKEGSMEVDVVDENQVEEVQPSPDQLETQDDVVQETISASELEGDSQQVAADNENSEPIEIDHEHPPKYVQISEDSKVSDQEILKGDVTVSTTAQEQTSEKSDGSAAENDPLNFNENLISTEEDIESVAAFYSIPIDLLRSNKGLFVSLMGKLSDYEKLKSSNQYLEINFEQLQHSYKKKLELAKDEIISAKKEFTNLSTTHKQLEDEKNKLESALRNSKNLANKNSKFVDDLKLKIAELENSKDNLSELLESKQSQLNDLSEEIKTLTNESKSIRKSMLELESTKETTNSELMTSKFEVARLERETKLLSDSRDWLETELKNKLSEFDRYRSEQSSKYSSVASELHALKQKYEISQTSLKNYAAELARLSSKNDGNQFQVKELSDKLQMQEKQFMEQISKRDEHIQVLEKSNKDKTNRISSLDKLYADTAEKVKKDEEDYKKLFEDLKSEIASKDVKIEELDKVVSDLSNKGAHLDGTGFQISSFAQKTLKDMNSELSLTDLITELNNLRKEVIKEKRAKTKAESELSNFLREFELKWPLFESYKDKCDDLKNKEEKLKVMVENLANDKSNLLKTCDMLRKKASESQLQIRNLTKLKVDLQRQLVILLTEIQFKVSGENLLTLEEKDYINKIVSSHGELRNVDETDTDKLISSRLVTFRNMAELIEQNEKLLTVSRSLGTELESKDAEGKDSIDEAENSTIRKAKEAISKLQEKINTLETQLKAATNSRDMLQNLFNSGAAAVGDATDLKANSERMETLVNEVKSKKQELASVRKSYETRIFELNSQVQDILTEKSNIALQLSKEKSSNELNAERISNLNSTISFMKKENEQLKAMLDKSQNNLSKLEANLQSANDSLIATKSSVIEFEIKAKTLVAEKEVHKSVEDQLRKDINRLYNEKSESNKMIIQLQTLDAENQAHFKETIQRYTNNTQSLQKDIDSLRNKLDKSNSEISSILHSKNVDSKVYQKRIDLLVEELGALKTTLTSKEEMISKLNEEITVLKKRQSNIDERKQSVLTSIANSSASSDDVMVLREELKNALEDLELATKDASQYKELSVATEQQLVSLNDTYEQYKNIAEGKITALTQEVENLKAASAKLTEEKEKLLQEAEDTKHSAELAKQEFNSKIEELNSSISTFDSIKKDYEDKLALVKSDIKSKDQTISELNGLLSDKVNQMETLETINNIIKRENADLKDKITGIEIQITQSNDMLKDEREKNKESLTKIEQETRNDKIRISELETQNRTLLNQLEESPLAYGESDDMKGLVAYLNREKDSLTQQLQYAQEEESVLRQNVSLKEKEIADLKSELAVVKEKSSTIDKYSDALAKMKGEVEELKVYKDNNNALRGQAKSYENKIKELESRLSVSSNRLTPLTTEVNNLKNEVSEKSKQIAQLNSQLQVLGAQLNESTAVTSEAAEKDKKIEELQSKYDERNQVIEKLRNQFNDRIKKMRAERQQALDETKELTTKVQALEKQLLDNESAPKGNEDSEKLKAQIRSLKEEIHQRTIENSTITKESTEKLNKIGEELANLKKELEESKSSGAVKQQSDDLAALEQKYIKEKEEALKKLELELKSKGTGISTDELEEFKKKLKAENDAQLQREIEAHKTRVRAPTQARINEIVEKRVKAKSEELEKQHEEKIKELEAKYNSAGSDNSGSFAKEKEGLVKAFEAEKEQLKKEIRAAVEKEKGFKEKFLQGKITRLEEQVKALEEEKKKMKQSAPPNIPNMPMVPNMMNMSGMPAMPFGQGGMFSNNNAFGNSFQPPMSPFNVASAAPNNKMPNAFSFGNNGNNTNSNNANANANSSTTKALPSKPGKRNLDESTEPEKRTKTE